MPAPDLVVDPLMDRFDIRYLAKKYWKLLLALPALGAAAGLAIALLQQPLFLSTAVILVDPSYDKIIQFENVDSGNRSDMEALKSLEIAIMADSVLLRVMNRLDLRNAEGFLPDKLASKGTPDTKILKFLRETRVSTSLLPETRLIRIEVLDPSPERAKLIADALSTEFETYLAEQRKDEIQDARKNLQVQAEIARSVALESEKNLAEFRRTHPEFPVEQDHALFSSRLTQFGDQLSAATGQRMQLESQKRALESLDPNVSPIEVIKVAGYTDMPHVSVLLDSLTNARAELSVVEERFTGEHSSVRSARAKMLRWDPLESTCRHASLSIL